MDHIALLFYDVFFRAERCVLSKKIGREESVLALVNAVDMETTPLGTSTFCGEAEMD